MNYWDDLKSIYKAVEAFEYKNKASLKWLKTQISSVIELVQLLDVAGLSESAKQDVANFNTMRNEIDHYSSLKERFDECKKELLLDLEAFIYRNSRNIS